MNLSSHHLAILALFATSIVVRVLPAFVRPRLNEAARDFVERVLPLAVFVNFGVYIVWTEVHIAPAAAIAGIATAALAAFFTRAGLLLVTCISTGVYVFVTLM